MENDSLLLLIIIFDLHRDAAVRPIAFMTAINFKQPWPLLGRRLPQISQVIQQQ